MRRKKPKIEDFFTHTRDFHASLLFILDTKPLKKAAVALDSSRGNVEKKQRAVDGRLRFADVLRTGLPKPPPAFPVLRNLSQAARLRKLY
jgi:hypothetical protein